MSQRVRRSCARAARSLDEKGDPLRGQHRRPLAFGSQVRTRSAVWPPNHRVSAEVL
jgi:hypothetical protein